VTFSEEQVRAMRKSGLNEEFTRRLHQHCVEEMGYLAEILPVLYRRETGDTSFLRRAIAAPTAAIEAAIVRKERSRTGRNNR
jgi:hypothetical protein